MPRAELDKCLLVKGQLEGEVSDVDHGKLDDIGVVRAGNGQGTEIYLIAKHAGKSRALKELFYEQGHGKASGTFTATKIADQKAGTTRITRLDYDTVQSVSRDDGDTTTTTSSAIVCTWPADGEPTCAWPYVLACKSEVDAKKSQSSATLTIGDDGKPVYKVGQDSPDTDCSLARK